LHVDDLLGRIVGVFEVGDEGDPDDHRYRDRQGGGDELVRAAVAGKRLDVLPKGARRSGAGKTHHVEPR
jgi:hypothetical protein